MFSSELLPTPVLLKKAYKGFPCFPHHFVQFCREVGILRMSLNALLYVSNIWVNLIGDNCNKTPTLKKGKRRDGKHFCSKGNKNASIPPSISKEAVIRVLQNAVLKWTHFERKGILTKNDSKMRPKFARKLCRKNAIRNYEI